MNYDNIFSVIYENICFIILVFNRPFIYPVRIKYKVFRKVVLKVRTTTRVISLDKIYN